jgi:cytochrome c-type biogenesis protein CcmE
MKNPLIKVMLTVAIVAGGIGFLIHSSMGSAEYYKMVDELNTELKDKPDKWNGKTIKVHGYVEAGSIKEDIVNQKTVRTFVLENKGQIIRVKHEGPKPDTFKDLSEVVAVGSLVKEGDQYVVHATELMAKCPSKYEGAGQNKDLGEQQKVFQ